MECLKLTQRQKGDREHLNGIERRTYVARSHQKKNAGEKTCKTEEFQDYRMGKKHEHDIQKK